MRGTTTDGIVIETIADPSVNNPVAIEGLPGVGNVGKLVVDHLLEEVENTLLRRIYSEHFPPQVTLDEDGTASLPMAEVHLTRVDKQDLLLISGNHQAVTAVGHYRLATAILDILETFGVEDIYAIGGMPTGEIVEDHAVIGAVSSGGLKNALTDVGVEFRAGEPAGGVVGVSGLLLGLGGKRDLNVSCLMGETSGYVVDPHSASVVLTVIESLVGFDISHERLEDRAEKVEEVIQAAADSQLAQNALPNDDNLRYID